MLTGYSVRTRGAGAGGSDCLEAVCVPAGGWSVCPRPPPGSLCMWCPGLRGHLLLHLTDSIDASSAPFAFRSHS